MQLSNDVITHNIAPFLNTSHLLRVRVTSKAFNRGLSGRDGEGYRVSDSSLWAVRETDGSWMVNDRRVDYRMQYGTPKGVARIDEECDEEIHRNTPPSPMRGRYITRMPLTYIVRNDLRVYNVYADYGVTRVAYATGKGRQIKGRSILVRFVDGSLRIFTNMDGELHYEGFI